METELHNQLEQIKEKLSIKEKEIQEFLILQKEEYEKNLKNRDQEINEYVDALVKENWELKKTIVCLEIEIENLKEKLFNQMSENYDDKLFYSSIKHIKEQTEIKEKEMIDKFEKLNRNLIKENKLNLANIRKIAFENKQKILDDESGSPLVEGESYVSIFTVEEQFKLNENRIKLLYEELKNKERYSLVIEQKYEMIVEENKLIKTKLKEEKLNILKTIDEIQIEHNNSINQLNKKFEEEISMKKNNLEKEFLASLSTSEDVINELIKEKNRISEELQSANDKIIRLKNELKITKKDYDDLNEKFNLKMDVITSFENLKNKMNIQNSELTIQKQILEKSTEDLTIKLNEVLIKLNSTQIENKLLNETLLKESEKFERKYNEIINTFNKEKENLNKFISDLKIKLEEESQNKQLLNQSNKEKLDLQNRVEILEGENSKKDHDLKMIDLLCEDLKFQQEKLQNKYNSLEDELNTKNSEMRNLKEMLAEREIEVSSIKKEIDRINKQKDENFFNFEESKKNNVLLTSQLENLKLSSGIEMQRMKNQLAELDKINEYNNKISELKKELNNYKHSINKLYKTFITKITIIIPDYLPNPGQEEFKMLEEIDLGYEKFLQNTKNKSSNSSIDQNLLNKYEEENKNLKKKLSQFMQITNSVGKSNPNSSNNSNSNFKSAEKENSPSLYESIIVYIKNTNLKHLLEIFQLNIQREEEIRTLLTDKNNPNNSSQLKKQISDLSNNFAALKTLCENVFAEYQQRAKSYIQPEEFEKRLDDYKLFTQGLLDMVLDTLMNYKMEVKDAIIFRMPINDYNHFIENISLNLENFNKKINLQIESYNKVGTNVEKALDALVKNTTVDYDILNNLISEQII
jgi:hypothetical protein